MKTEYNFKELLHTIGEKATTARISMLSALSEERYPLSIKELSAKIKSANQSTLYRSLKTMVAKGLVREVMLSKSNARYEISIGRKHHHHIVCTSCGFMEDIHACKKGEEEVIKKSSQKFAEITGHSLEFFGMCKSCVKK